MRRMWRQVGALQVIGGLAIVAGACDILEPDGCDICTTSAVVYGTVHDSSGAAVAGSMIDVRVYRDTCGSSEFGDGGTDNGRPRTGLDGRYRAKPISLFGPFTAKCLIVTVDPLHLTPASFGVDTVHMNLGFRSDYRGGVRDSVRVDVVVPRAN